MPEIDSFSFPNKLPGGGRRAPGYGGGAYGAPPYGGGHLGGFAPQGAHGPPPGAGPQLWRWFTLVDTDRSGAITAVELSFDLDTVKLLMTILDTDRSGTIGFNEFAGLWKYTKDWQNVLKQFDRDRSGSIELRDALAQFGYNLSPSALRLLQFKLPAAGLGMPGMPGHAGGGLPGISFDRFVRACVVVKQLSEAFGRLDADRDGWIQIGYEGFMETVLSLP
ncbi:hypothetical protein B0H17DRAFT_1330794 [Mycena rosella]|uniref:EF-hand domain-containing protein n=1 Tax=Mycena rosella TaxID=1033263 RepID=A0AAD7DI06_MYCRO|nr:hypothetical protein B0H17DRAFT_1330794 [Mycena rosella]